MDKTKELLTNKSKTKTRIIIAAILFIVLGGIFYLCNGVFVEDKNAISSSCGMPYGYSNCRFAGVGKKEGYLTVAKIQQMLKNIKISGKAIYKDSADGNFGPKTKSAVISFQKSQGQTADGYVGPDTLERLAKATGTQYYIIRYDKNFGSGSLNNSYGDKQVVIKGVNTKTPTTVLTKRGYVHVGWTVTVVRGRVGYQYACTSANCQNGSQSLLSTQNRGLYPYVYPIGVTVSNTANNGETVIFTAKYCETGYKYNYSKSKCELPSSNTSGGNSSSGSSSSSSGSTSTNNVSYKIYGSNGGIVVNEKYYAKNNQLTPEAIGTSTIYGNNNGKTQITVKGSFPSSIYQGFLAPPCNAKAYYTMQLISYNKSGTQIEKRSSNVMSSSVSLTVTLTKDVSYLKLQLYKEGACQKPIGANIYDKTLNAMAIPQITVAAQSSSAVSTLADTSSNTMEYSINSNSTYYTKFTFNNPTGRAFWYKWFTYSNDSWDYRKIGYEGACTSSSATTLSIGPSNSSVPLGLKASDTYPNRRGYIRVYASKSACDSDTSKSGGALGKKAIYQNSSTNGSTRKYISSATVVYRKQHAYKNSGGAYIVNGFNTDVLKKITSDIGSQYPGNCHMYSAAYGAYILLGKNPGLIKKDTYYDRDLEKTITRSISGNANGTDDSCLTCYTKFGGKLHSNGTYPGLYKAIVNKIDQGIPVSLHVYGASNTHWVLVVGYYKTDYVDKNNILSKFMIIDPYSTSGYNNYSNTLWYGKGSERYVSTRGIHSQMDYVTWDSLASAK